MQSRNGVIRTHGKTGLGTGRKNCRRKEGVTIVSHALTPGKLGSLLNEDTESPWGMERGASPQGQSIWPA